MFIVFNNVNFYICVFITSSTSYCVCDTLVDPMNVYVYICMYVCMYVCAHARARACVCVCTYVCMKDHIRPWAAWLQR